MKYNTLKKNLAGMLVVASFLPVFAFAEDSGAMTQPVKTEKVVRAGNNFCANIITIQTKIADQITKKEDKQTTNQKDRTDKITKKEGDADAKRALGRSTVDEKRLKNWSKMETKATTDAQKAAVATYKQAITDAVTLRRTAVDVAVKTYRDGLTTAMTSHSTALVTAMATFKSSVDAAATKAQADCTAQVASKTVKDSFYKAVGDARKVLQDAKKQAEISSGLTALKTTRNDAIKAAEATFKTATEKARADLILALKK